MGSTWNFAFLAYQPRHPLLQYAVAGVVRNVLSQARAMRLGLPSRCYSPVSCVLTHGQSACPPLAPLAPLAVPPLGSCASSGRAWRLWAARHSKEEASPLGAQPTASRLLERTASKAAMELPAFDHAGAQGHRARLVRRTGGGGGAAAQLHQQVASAAAQL